MIAKVLSGKLTLLTLEAASLLDRNKNHINSRLSKISVNMFCLPFQ